MTVILASASPRRSELLSRILSDFVVVPSAADETFPGLPAERALAAARAKAYAVASGHDGTIIAADTIVVVDGRVLGKPTTRDDAAGMLAALSDRTHEVITGLCLLLTDPVRERTAVERTTVHFRALSAREIDEYLDSEEYVDKAGAYAIQGRAALFVDRICGDFYNVMGLPLCTLTLLLREMGVAV